MLQDLRYACRILYKSPGFAAVVILTLAVGIGANTAVFSLVNGALLQPLPYKDPAQLVDVLDASVKDPNLSKSFGSYRDFEEYSAHAHSFEKIAFVTWATGSPTLTGRGPARNVMAVLVSEDFFSLLGVSAARGRTFEEGDSRHGCSVVLSEGFWRDALAGDPDIPGKTLELDHRACTVLGIMPARFEFYPRQTQLWLLLTTDDPRPRDRLITISMGRLKPGVNAAQAQAELAPLHQEIHKGDWQRDFRPVVNSLQDEFTFLAGRNLRATLGILVVAVALVLLIACLNVANLLLARASLRAREFAVRAALGSGRLRLIRQSLVEGLMLALMGGAAGVLVARASVKYFLSTNPIELPVGSNITISVPVFVFTALVTISTALVCGMAPAWTSSRTDVNTGLRTAGRGGIHGPNRGLVRVLVASEIGLSLMLLAGASLLMRSVLKMSAVPLGFEPGGVTVMSTTLPEKRYSGSAERLRFYDDLRRNLNAIPGAEASAIATNMPPYGWSNSEIQIDGKARTGVQDVGQSLVSADYFQVLRIALRRGRLFDRQEGPNSEPVAVVNEALAREYFPEADPIGQRIRTFGFKEGPWVTIVGVVATEKRPELFREMAWHEQAALYRPIEQESVGSFSIALRTRGDGLNPGHAMERAVTDIDQEVPAGGITTLRGRLGAYLKYPRFRAIVLNQFAGFALLLAALGLHGLVSQYVSLRTRELGLRMALGAKARDIVRLVAVEGGIPVLAGLVIGMVSMAAISRYLTSLLFDVTTADPLTMVAAPAALLVAAMAAIAKPAWDAAAVDPAIALRDE